MMYALIIIFTAQTTPLQIAQMTGIMVYNNPNRQQEAQNVSRHEYYSLSECDKAMEIVQKKDAINMPRRIESIVCYRAGY